MAKPTLRQRFQYRFDNAMARGTSALIALLALVTILLIVVFAVVVLATHSYPQGSDDLSWSETLWLNLMHALDAGAVGADYGWAYRWLMLLVTIGGLFVVASLISIISGAFDSKVEELRKGRSTVIEKGHTVILGWNSKVAPIIAELAIANESERRAAVVVLADRDKVEMEDAIRDSVADLRGTRVICRTGDPMDQDDLLLANPFEARSVIVLGDEDHSDPDSRAIKTTLALRGHPERAGRKLHIVGQIRTQDNVDVARLVGKDEAQWILAHEKIGQITAQTSRQPGLSLVYSELLSFDGCEIYFYEAPTLVGQTYFDAQLAFADSSVVGVVADGAVDLNPPATRTIAAGEQLVLVAEDDSAIALSSPGTPDAKAVQTARSPAPKPEKTLVIGFNSRVPALLAELDQYVAAGSQVTLMSAIPVAGMGKLKNSTVKVVEADGAKRDALDKVKPGSFDHVIVVAYRDDRDKQDADAKTLVTLLHLREIFSELPKAPNVVSEMLDDRNRKLAEVTRADDFIVSDNITSLMMAQVSENPLLADVFDGLFGADGAEVYLRPAEWYVKPGVEVDFYTVLAGAKRRGETAFGYRVAAHGEELSSVVVNPAKAGRVAFQPGDSVVVLAED